MSMINNNVGKNLKINRARACPDLSEQPFILLQINFTINNKCYYIRSHLKYLNIIY